LDMNDVEWGIDVRTKTLIAWWPISVSSDKRGYPSLHLGVVIAKKQYVPRRRNVALRNPTIKRYPRTLDQYASRKVYTEPRPVCSLGSLFNQT
jgi:hypothetical protein